MNTADRPIIKAPNNERNLLLHSCCAPCEGEVLETLLHSQIQPTVFYNPNIHPKKEYEIRKLEDKKFCEKLGVEHVDADYDVRNWFDRVKGLEWEPERGGRCTVCFDMGAWKEQHFTLMKINFNLFSSSLGLSRWKNMKQINGCGERAASRYQNLTYWTYNWRKSGGSQRMIEISKRENFYQQEYCGCVYSLWDTNKWRVSQGRKEVEIGKTFTG